jgi:hypothetical protein
MIEIKNIKDIKSNPKNPRTIKNEKFLKLVQSIKDFPEMLNVRPIVVNKDMVVLGGNMRLKACIEAGLKEVPVIVSELDEEKQKQFLIKDNVSYGEWDYMLLKDYDSLNEWGMDLPDYFTSEEEDFLDDDFFDDYEEDERKPSILIDEAATPSIPVSTVYILLMLKQVDYDFIKDNEQKLFKSTNTNNISDCLIKLIKKI